MAPPKRGHAGRGRRGRPAGQVHRITAPLQAPNQPPPTHPPQRPAAPPGSRVLPINRRLGYSPANATQPHRRAVNGTEEAHRIEALRNQLRHPYAVLNTTLRWHLVRESWDVNRAAESFRDANSGTLLPGHPPITTRRGRTVETSRLRLLHDTARALRNYDSDARKKAEKKDKKPGRTRATKNANLASLFHQNNWVSDTVLKEISARRGNYDSIVDDLGPLRTGPSGIAERDERLAWFITVTATESWYSARVMLENHGWDVARTVDAWIRRGGVQVVMPSSRTNMRGRVVTEVENNGMRGFEVNDPAIMRKNDEDSDFDSESSSSSSSSDDEDDLPSTNVRYEPGLRTRSGYVIDEDRTPARVNCPDASKLRIETIHDQKYKIKYFPGHIIVDGEEKPFRWNDTEDVDHSDEAEFDWSNAEYITRLNCWREEYFRRWTGELVRQETISFNKHELDWLREQEAMRHEEEFYRIAGQSPLDPQPTNPVKWAEAEAAFAEGTHRFPLHITARELQELTDRFNRTFAGKRVYQKIVDLGNGKQSKSLKVFDKPRPERTPQSILTQRARVASLCRHFMKSYHDPHDKGKELDEQASEVDSDFEGQESRKRGRDEDSGG